jgi:hypothetical protein
VVCVCACSLKNLYKPPPPTACTTAAVAATTAVSAKMLASASSPLSGACYLAAATSQLPLRERKATTRE